MGGTIRAAGIFKQGISHCLPHFYAFVNRQHCRFTFYFYRCRIEEVVSTQYSVVSKRYALGRSGGGKEWASEQRSSCPAYKPGAARSLQGRPQSDLICPGRISKPKETITFYIHGPPGQWGLTPSVPDREGEAGSGASE